MSGIYNEIYGLYYLMLDKILAKASKEDITLEEINQLVSQYGFSESSLYFTPDVVSQGAGYNLLKKSEEGYTSILKTKPTNQPTSLQKGFIKSMLTDQRLGLFLDPLMLQELNKAFAEVEPLFNLEDTCFTDTALDSDNYSDEKYVRQFRTLLDAIRSKSNLRICFNNSKGERITTKLAPYKLEYAVRDDKFRLCGVSIVKEKPKGYVKINLARILSITVLKQSWNIDFEAFIAAKKKALPIEIEVSNIRNGFERVFIGLSNYERVSSYDEETGKCTIKIYYTADDEQELLILLLSFGPAIKVLGPTNFKKKFVDRIEKQMNLFNKP